MKKIIALILCVFTVVGIFAGCGGKDPGTGGDENTIVIGIPQSALVMDYDENALTKWLEETTGYDIEFQKFAASSADYGTQLSTMTASGLELPDMLLAFDLGDAVLRQYGQDGYFIDLKPYYDDKEGKAKIWWDRFSELDPGFQETVMKILTEDDGSMYAFPEIQTSMVDNQAYTPWINTKWLDKVGMQIPTNIDELYNVLKAFHTQDPNGNGNPDDEIPLIGTNGLCGSTMAWIINMFVYMDETKWYNIDDNGKLYLPQTTDAYREALKFMNKLREEGLMSPLCFTSVSVSDMKQMVTPPDASQVQRAGIVVCHPTVCFTQDHEGILDYAPVPLWGNAVFDDDRCYKRAFITEDCENPDAAWEILMQLSTLEGSLRLRYGDLGTNWDWADEGATSIMGIPAQYILHGDVWSTQGTDNWRTVTATILVHAEQEAVQLTGNEPETTLHKYDMFKQMKAEYDRQIAEYNPDESHICPKIRLNDEEEEKTEQIRSDVRGMITKARAEFCTGVRDINDDAQWNAYLKSLDDLKMNVMLEQAQQIYERDYK